MELYHALNRGVDKRIIFLDDRDRARFVHDMYEFNDSAPVDNTRHRFEDSNTDIVSPYLNTRRRERIVDIHGWCLMGNHYHLLLSERKENGMSLFLRKLNIGYAKYFNERHKREGTLFQGRTKKVHIVSHAHFLHILHYIHLNPLDFVKETKDWRRFSIRNSKRALEQLATYRWSSFRDYCDKKNFPSVLTTSLFAGVFGNYKKTISAYLKDIELAPESLLLE